MELKGSVVVLTGASRGLGERMALDLAGRGAHLVLSARDAAALEKVATACRAAGGEATIVAGDVSQATDRQRLVTAAEAVGPVDVLVNNAGIEIAVSVLDQREDDIDRQLQVNLSAPIHLTRAFLPGMLARRKGVVVMISSMSGKGPTPYNAIYAAAKHGMNGFTSSLRLELAGTGVHAGVVCPSFVAEAGMWSDTGLKAPAAMREVPPQKVVAAVRKVISGAAEVLVTPGPIRPMLALGQLFPALDTFVLSKMGIIRALQARAEVVQRGRALPASNDRAP
jgi:short-subunit dehydrogenase